MDPSQRAIRYQDGGYLASPDLIFMDIVEAIRTEYSGAEGAYFGCF